MSQPFTQWQPDNLGNIWNFYFSPIWSISKKSSKKIQNPTPHLFYLEPLLSQHPPSFGSRWCLLPLLSPYLYSLLSFPLGSFQSNCPVQILQCSSITFGIKCKSHHIIWPRYLRVHLLLLPLTFSSWGTLAFPLLWPQGFCTTCPSCLGWFPPENCGVHFLTLFMSLLKCHLLRETFPDSLSKVFQKYSSFQTP